MAVDAIDHVVHLVPRMGPAAARYEQLGFALSPLLAHPHHGHELRVATAGTERPFRVELRAPAGRAALTPAELAICEQGGGLSLLVLRAAELDEVRARLSSLGIAAESEEDAWGRAALRLPEQCGLGAPVTIVAGEATGAEHPGGALGFAVRRLDHLAVMTRDLEAATEAWERLLSLRVTGEVRTPAMIIRQIAVGEAVIELIAPSGPESPVSLRPPGLVSMLAWEVEDVGEAVSLLRRRGVTVTDPADGLLPSTRTATVPASEFGGVSIQLLEYLDGVRVPGQAR